jgi:archaetidylinositol phosphate synthase
MFTTWGSSSVLVAGDCVVGVRQNEGFLASYEQRAIAIILDNMSPAVTPFHLTVVGLIGAVVTVVGLVGSNFSPAFLPLVPFGLAVNWFGDSLDGSLARFRRIERPRYGFLVDHSSDLLSQTLITIGFGLSPFFTLTSALIILIMYLLISAYTYIRITVDNVHQMTYGGMGATEFRVLMAIWAIVAFNIGPSIKAPSIGPYATLDLIVGTVAFVAFVAFVWKAHIDAVRVGHEERTDSRDSSVVIYNLRRDATDRHMKKLKVG